MRFVNRFVRSEMGTEWESEFVAFDLLFEWRQGGIGDVGAQLGGRHDPARQDSPAHRSFRLRQLCPALCGRTGFYIPRFPSSRTRVRHAPVVNYMEFWQPDVP